VATLQAARNSAESIISIARSDGAMARNRTRSAICRLLRDAHAEGGCRISRCAARGNGSLCSQTVECGNWLPPKRLCGIGPQTLMRLRPKPRQSKQTEAEGCAWHARGSTDTSTRGRSKTRAIWYVIEQRWPAEIHRLLGLTLKALASPVTFIRFVW